jgi:hypothetical protein
MIFAEAAVTFAMKADTLAAPQNDNNGRPWGDEDERLRSGEWFISRDNWVIINMKH